MPAQGPAPPLTCSTCPARAAGQPAGCLLAAWSHATGLCRWLAGWLLAGALLGLPGLAHASDAALEEALRALREQNLPRLQMLARRMAGHPMKPYVDYWSIRLLPDDRSIQAFLQDHPSGALPDRLRIDWVRGLARREAWPLIAEVVPAIETPPDDVACWGLRARVALQDRAAAQALLDGPWRRWRELPEGCARAAAELAQDGRLATDAIWQRARNLVGLTDPMVARRTLARLPRGQSPTPRQLDLALGQPERWLQTPDAWKPGRLAHELSAMALVRVAGANPGQAGLLMHRHGRRVDANLRGYVYAQIGLQQARRLDPQAHAWFARARPMQLTDEHCEWWARAALRAGEWPAVRDAVRGMSAWALMTPRWQYWLGRAEAEVGHRPLAEGLWLSASRDPGFYGRLAREALGHPLGDEPIGEPGKAELAAVARLPGIARSVALHRLKLGEEAGSEWVRASRQLGGRELAAAAAYARQLGLWPRVIEAAEYMRPGHALTLRYPTPYRDLVRKAAGRFQVDEALVYGVMHQESRFQPQVTSIRGARGLMQVMPETARWLAEDQGWPGFDIRLHDTPATNITMGTRYLRQLESDLGVRVLATAAYNAGPGRALAWRAPRELEGAIYAESIPFDETRDYVQRVMTATVHYDEMLGRRTLSLQQSLGRVPPAPAPSPTPMSEASPQALPRGTSQGSSQGTPQGAPQGAPAARPATAARAAAARPRSLRAGLAAQRVCSLRPCPAARSPAAPAPRARG